MKIGIALTVIKIFIEEKFEIVRRERERTSIEGSKTVLNISIKT